MPLSREQFVTSIHEECLEQAGFLYQQRNTLLARGALTRRELGRLERRLEAFVDALEVRADAAVELCLERASQGDAGETYATTRLLSRLGAAETWRAFFGTLPEALPAQVVSLRDGLCHALPGGTLPDPTQLPESASLATTAPLAEALGQRRQGGGAWVRTRLQQALSGGPLQGAEAHVRALGRLQPPGAAEVLGRCLEVEDSVLRVEAAFALLRLADARETRSFLAPRTFPPWACLAVAVGGGPAVVPRLTALAEEEPHAVEALLALGILGEASAVPVLLAHLSVPSHAGAAADALALLTGAALVEPHEETEEPSEDEEQARSGPADSGVVPPTKVESASGLIQVRASRNPEDWRRWWAANQTRFPPGRRFRAGTSCSPGQLLELLEHGVGEDRCRQLLAEELVIRYGLDVGFEPGALLHTQVSALAQGRALLQQRQSRFNPGRWYLGGALAP